MHTPTEQNYLFRCTHNNPRDKAEVLSGPGISRYVYDIVALSEVVTKYVSSRGKRYERVWFKLKLWFSTSLMTKIAKKQRLFMAKRLIFSINLRVVVYTLSYEAETWVMRKDERQKLRYIMKMKCLGSVCGATRMERLGNEEVRRRVGVKEKTGGRVDRKILKWFGHVKRMSGQWLTKKVCESRVEGRSDRGRPYEVAGLSQKRVQCEFTGAERCKGIVHRLTELEGLDERCKCIGCDLECLRHEGKKECRTPMKWHLPLHWSLGGAGPYNGVCWSFIWWSHRPDNHISSMASLQYVPRSVCVCVERELMLYHFIFCQSIPSHGERALV